MYTPQLVARRAARKTRENSLLEVIDLLIRKDLSVFLIADSLLGFARSLHKIRSHAWEGNSTVDIRALRPRLLPSVRYLSS